MPQINPETLRKLRKQQRLTLDRLARKATVDKQTIHRLERGQRAHVRENTLTNLAKALGVDPEALTESLPEEGASSPTWDPNKSQINIRISDQARNALLLVCERYRVRPAQVVELAPLLFNWVAEKCLQQRAQRIDTLRQREGEISEQIERFSSEVSNLTDGPPPPFELPDLTEFWSGEDQALYFRYLFSFSDDFGGIGRAGPIVDLLRDLASQLGDEAEFAGWDANSSPAYSICKEEATWLANGDEIAVKNILQGYAPLHELPKEFWDQLRTRNTLRVGEDADTIRRRQAAERVRWLRAHGRLDESPEVAT